MVEVIKIFFVAHTTARGLRDSMQERCTSHHVVKSICLSHCEQVKVMMVHEFINHVSGRLSELFAAND